MVINSVSSHYLVVRHNGFSNNCGLSEVCLEAFNSSICNKCTEVIIDASVRVESVINAVGCDYLIIRLRCPLEFQKISP